MIVFEQLLKEDQAQVKVLFWIKSLITGQKMSRKTKKMLILNMSSESI